MKFILFLLVVGFILSLIINHPNSKVVTKSPAKKSPAKKKSRKKINDGSARDAIMKIFEQRYLELRGDKPMSLVSMLATPIDRAADILIRDFDIDRNDAREIVQRLCSGGNKAFYFPHFGLPCAGSTPSPWYMRAIYPSAWKKRVPYHLEQKRQEYQERERQEYQRRNSSGGK